MPFNLSVLPIASLSATVLAAAKTTTKSSGSSYSLLILLALFMLVYFFYLRPQRQKLRAQQQAMQRADVGDEVVTTGGIIGRVQSFDGDRVTIDAGNGQILTIHRNHLGRRLDPPPPDDEMGDADDPTLDGDADTTPPNPGSNGAPNANWWPEGTDTTNDGGTS